MIRFVDLGTQLDEDEPSFAFFDTIPNRFVDLGGVQVFESREDLEEVARIRYIDNAVRDRLVGLIPEEWPEAS